MSTASAVSVKSPSPVPTHYRWLGRLFEQSTNVEAVNRFSGRSVICFDRDGDGKYGVFMAQYGSL